MFINTQIYSSITQWHMCNVVVVPVPLAACVYVYLSTFFVSLLLFCATIKNIQLLQICQLLSLHGIETTLYFGIVMRFLSIIKGSQPNLGSFGTCSILKMKNVSLSFPLPPLFHWWCALFSFQVHRIWTKIIITNLLREEKKKLRIWQLKSKQQERRRKKLWTVSVSCMQNVSLIRFGYLLFSISIDDDFYMK